MLRPPLLLLKLIRSLDNSEYFKLKQFGSNQRSSNYPRSHSTKLHHARVMLFPFKKGRRVNFAMALITFIILDLRWEIIQAITSMAFVTTLSIAADASTTLTALARCSAQGFSMASDKGCSVEAHLTNGRRSLDSAIDILDSSASDLGATLVKVFTTKHDNLRMESDVIEATAAAIPPLWRNPVSIKRFRAKRDVHKKSFTFETSSAALDGTVRSSSALARSERLRREFSLKEQSETEEVQHLDTVSDLNVSCSGSSNNETATDDSEHAGLLSSTSRHAHVEEVDVTEMIAHVNPWVEDNSLEGNILHWHLDT
ncbi:hypothetical protein BXZ70DRAFT_953627 [Cristinia sonorae]|uniref:Uncharacterized protein n=1 Tax=Cristinia sonorae TaxID=1940300 RepID=A0A8K0UJ62_9AGAR|nr:hypothetical protein BXZ70DRAFT_953627 [Cristinia sonorae]